MTLDDFKTLCQNRRSIRYYDDKTLSKEDVLSILDVARLAPSVENLQPWHFHVVMGKETREKLMEASCYGNFVGGAAAFIVVTADHSLQSHAKDVLWNPKELEYSCMAAMENILLAATAMGIGSSWVSLHHGTAHELLQLPRTQTVVGGIMLGHYKRGEEKGLNGHERKPLTDMCTFHD